MSVLIILLAVIAYQSLGLLMVRWGLGKGEAREHGEALLNFWAWPLGLVTVPLGRWRTRQYNKQAAKRRAAKEPTP